MVAGSSAVSRTVPDRVADLYEECYTRGWTDGLPVVPPTEQRVERMIGDSGDADAVIATLLPSGAFATRKLIAANAVMAGCLPEYLPIVEAAVRAVSAPQFNLDRVMTTASSQSPVIVVNGPTARAVELGGDGEALGSELRAAATIGRATMLVLRNLASYGASPHSTLGNPSRRGFCFTESPGLSPWPTWHVDQGLDAQRTWVSVFPAESPLTIVDMGHEDADSVLRTIAESISIPGSYNAFFRQDLWLVVSPQHAELLARDGLTRADVAREIHERAALPAERLRGRGLYGYIDELMPPVWLDSDHPVRITDEPAAVKIFVAGAEFGGYTAALFGEGRTVTEEVVLR